MHHVLPRVFTRGALAKGLAIAGFAVMLVATLAQSARAAGPSLIGGGLHISTGALVDPVGRTWVSDHNGGFCRMTEPSDEEPGTIDHPQQAGDPGPRTCLGGLMPEAAAGPDAAGAPVFIDPTPQFEDSGEEVALVPDGASPSDSVWRHHWNPDSRKFEGAEEIHMTADPNEDRPRPVALSLGSDGNVYVVFQRSGTVQRIEDPAGDSPSVALVASTSDGRGASALAAVPGPLGPLGPPTIVVAEATGLTQTSGAPSPNPAAPRNAVPSSYVAPAGAAISALAYKEGNGLEGTGSLFLGTAETVTPDAPLDRVLRYDAPGAAFTVHATRLTMIGGLAVRPDANALLVLDDPALVTEGEPIGMGRLFSVGEPYANILTGPSNEDRIGQDPSHTADTTPTFTFTGDFTQRCAVAKGSAALSFSACESPFTPATALEDGDYRFAVRSVTPNGTVGRMDVRRFTVDTVAPAAAPTIISPDELGYVSSRPFFEFEPAQGETEYAYECRFDAEIGFGDCAEGRSEREFADGEHKLQIRQIDGAGNIGGEDSHSAIRTFNVGQDPDPGADPVVNADPLSHPNSWANYARGLHIASGAIEDPAGKIWVSDHNGGFCRIADPTLKGSGHIDHPERAGMPGPRTCLGGLLPEARLGADAAGQPALVDPTPKKPGSGDEVALVPDGATKMASLFRAQWNKATKRFDPLDEFVGVTDPADPADGPRPTAAATGTDPDGPSGPLQPAVYYVTKVAPWIVRINNPASANATAEVVGYANDAGRSRRAGESIAVGSREVNGQVRDVVYVGEAGGVTRLIPSADGLPAVSEDDVTTNGQLIPFIATPVTLPGVATNAGLAYDRARHQLYVGTANAVGPAPVDVGIDRVHRFQVGGNINANNPTYTPDGVIGEFSMVGGIGLRADGRVLVMDDVALITDGEPLGMGRVVQVGGPGARVAAGPSNVAGQTAVDPTHTADRTPTFEVAGDAAALECWVREADSTTDPAFAPCSGEFTTGQLAEGEHLLTVRAAPAVPGTDDDPTRIVPDTLRFTVDADSPNAPDLSVTEVQGQTSAAPWFTFTPAGETGDGFSWTCSLNGAAAQDCAPGRTFPLVNGQSQLRSGSNSLVVRAIDLAGNAGEPGTLQFNADTTLPTVSFTTPAARQSSRTATFTFSASETGAVFGCGFDGADIGPCPGTATNGTHVASYANLADGTHTLRVRARDARGNMGPVVERSVTVDNTGPSVLFDAPAGGSTTGSTMGVAWHVNPATVGAGESGQTFTCQLDNGATNACTSPLNLSGLGNGLHTLRVTARDDLGNAGPTASVSWNVSAPAAQSVPVPAAPAPAAGVLGTSAANAVVSALRIAPVIQVATIRDQGVPVTVQTAAGQTTVRIQVFQVTGGQTVQAAKAKAKRKLIATVFKSTKKAKTYRFKLKDGKLSRLQPGRYVVEVRAGKSRTRLGKAKTRTFVVRGR
jgi:hypothetical protein